MGKVAGKFLFPMIFICFCTAAGAESLRADDAVKAPEPVKVTEPERQVSVVKLGYLDLAKIAAESAAGKAASVKLKENKEKLQVQINARQKQLEKLKTTIQAKFVSLSPQQKEAKAKEFQKKVEEFQKFVNGAGKEMLASEEEMSSRIYQSVEKAAGELGKAKGFAAIVVKRELFYIGGGVDAEDVTGEIIKMVGGGK